MMIFILFYPIKIKLTIIISFSCSDTFLLENQAKILINKIFFCCESSVLPNKSDFLCWPTHLVYAYFNHRLKIISTLAPFFSFLASSIKMHSVFHSLPLLLLITFLLLLSNRSFILNPEALQWLPSRGLQWHFLECAGLIFHVTQGQFSHKSFEKKNMSKLILNQGALSCPRNSPFLTVYYRLVHMGFSIVLLCRDTASWACVLKSRGLSDCWWRLTGTCTDGFGIN